MHILIVSLEKQYEEKELSTFTCCICNKLGMSYADKSKEIKPHYCLVHDPLLNRKEIDE